MSQGGAYVGNLITGTVLLQPVMDRATPYHVPHSTTVAGYAIIYGADDRWCGNIFVGTGGDPADTARSIRCCPACVDGALRNLGLRRAVRPPSRNTSSRCVTRNPAT